MCISFYNFSRRNREVIYGNNTQYISSATKQMAMLIDNYFAMHLAYITELGTLFPYIIEKSAEYGLLETIGMIVNNNIFQEMYFILKDGSAISSTGRQEDLTDTVLYKTAMSGTPGILFEPSQQLHAGSFVFYAPVQLQNQTTGIITGSIPAERLIDLLGNTFFEEPTFISLFDKDGTVLMYSKQNDGMTSFLHDFIDAENQNPDWKSIQAIIAERDETVFSTDDHCIIAGHPIAYAGLYLVHIFPDSINKPMFSTGLRNGEILVLEILVIFICFIIWLVTHDIQAQKQLTNAAIEQSYIISNISSLFSQVFYLNFDEDTFQTIFEQDGYHTTKFEDHMSAKVLQILTEDNIAQEDIDKFKILFSPIAIADSFLENDGQRFIEIEYRRTISGELRWMRAEAIVTQKEKGLPVALLITTQDITRIKQEQEEIYKLFQDSYETAINASNFKTDFLSRISHDVRTPLNAIIGMTAIASKYITDKERVTSCLSKITIASNHLLNLINEVLDMSKIESGSVDIQTTQINLKDIITNILTINQTAVQNKKQQLIPAADKIEHEIVIGDETRLMQILMNLLSNSIKYTPPGGTITLTIRELPTATNSYADYEFIISDNGIGMQKDFLEHIFKPFARASDARIHKIQGTGLGMCITQNLVQLMRGSIDVESELGKGTTFTVHLSFTLPKNSENKKLIANSNLAGQSILLADDDMLVRELIRRTATELGLKCDTVNSGERAVSLVKNKTGIPYFAIFIDWQMPDKDGIETTKQLRKLISSMTPIILISAFDMDEGFQEIAKKAGVTGLIEKPLFKSSILQVLERCGTGITYADTDTGEHAVQTDLQNRHILIAEDNELNMEIACELVSSCNAVTDTAANGQEALDKYLSAPDGYYSLILMDIQMPEMDGYEATQRIRASGKSDAASIPIIAMTADAFAEDIKKTLASGMNDHIAKPIDVNRLNQCLRYWLPPPDAENAAPDAT